MENSELLYLAIVAVTFLGFMAVLAYVSRSSANP